MRLLALALISLSLGGCAPIWIPVWVAGASLAGVIVTDTTILVVDQTKPGTIPAPAPKP